WGGRIALVQGTAVLPLWPLVLYAPPLLLDADAPGQGRRLERPVAQLYVRKGKLSLHFLPFGVSEICQSAGDETPWEAFHRLFPRARAQPPGAGFEEEMCRDARHVVGREADVAAVQAALREPGAVLWLGGVAGVGKSYLVARVAADLLADPPADTLVVP